MKVEILIFCHSSKYLCLTKGCIYSGKYGMLFNIC